MSLLFDTSPDEPQKRKGRARKAAPPDQEAAVAEKPLIYLDKVAHPPLGRLDGTVACIDQNCRAECHDILDEVRGQWRLECCFCGTCQWVPVVEGHLAPPAEGAEFVLRGGRFDGQTLGVVSRSSRGMAYLTWAAKEHPRPAVKKACETYLASIQSAG